MQTAMGARDRSRRRVASETLSRWLRGARCRAIPLLAPTLAGLPACDDTPGIDPGCQGIQCPLLAGEPILVASRSSDVAIHNLTLARSSDGATVAAGWSELSDQDRLLTTTSSDGGETFGDTVQVAAPKDVELSYMHLLLPDGAGLLAGAVAHFPDPMVDSSHSWPRIFKSSDSGKTFKQSIDLKSATGERSFIQGSFASSADGKTLVWAWVDTTPAAWLEPDSPPSPAVLASISSDSGAKFAAPQVVSTTPFVSASRISAFVRDGRPGVVYAEERTVAGEPVKAGVAALALSDKDGKFQKPVLVASNDYGVIPAGGAAGADGAAPGAALGEDGSIHVVWWSARTIGLWYAVTQDGKAFTEPVRVLDTLSPTPATPRVAVDGNGTAWIAALDQSSVRIVQVPLDAPPSEFVDAAAELGSTGDTFAIVGLPDRGAVQLWLGAAANSETGTSPWPIQLRRIAP